MGEQQERDDQRAGMVSRHRGWSPASACVLVLFAALASGATLFLGGDIGRWNDDYFFLRQFDRGVPPGTDLDAPMPVRAWVLDGSLHFWRPLYRYVFTPIVVALYERVSVLHVLAAVNHAAVCAGLWVLLRRFGAGRTPAAVGAMLFLVYPAHFEGSLWVTCSPTAFATGLMLLVMWLQARWARSAIEPCRWTGRRWLLAAVPGMLAFAACSFNEQPAFLTATLPVVAWCAVGTRGLRARGLAILAPAGIAGVLVLGYFITASIMHPQRVGTNTGGVVHVREIGHAVVRFVDDVWARQVLRGFALGAWQEGLVALREEQIKGAVVLGVVVLAGLGWVLSAGRLQEGEDRPNGGGEGWFDRKPGAALMVLGAAVFMVGWGPLVVIHYPASPRLAYAPSVGLALLMAGMLQAVLRRASGAAAERLVRLSALAALISGMVMMIGVQHGYRARWRADERQGRALREQVPSPGGVPRTVFIPVRVADQALRTGARMFDGYFQPPLTSGWAAGWWLQKHYRRRDVVCVQGWRGERSGLEWIDEGRVQTELTLVPPAKRAGTQFDLAQVVPFEVREDGEVVVYTHVRLEGAGEKPPTIALPAVATALAEGRIAARVLKIPQGQRSSGGESGE